MWSFWLDMENIIKIIVNSEHALAKRHIGPDDFKRNYH